MPEIIEKDNNQNTFVELESMVKQNRELLEKVYESTEKIKKYLYWLKVMNIFKVFIILVPLILSYFFLEPILKKILQPYGI
jgi:hypothetical protein